MTIWIWSAVVLSLVAIAVISIPHRTKGTADDVPDDDGPFGDVAPIPPMDLRSSARALRTARTGDLRDGASTPRRLAIVQRRDGDTPAPVWPGGPVNPFLAGESDYIGVDQVAAADRMRNHQQPEFGRGRC